MKWVVKYEGQGVKGIAILWPHNTSSHRWYDDLNKAHAHLEAHQKLEAYDGYKFWIEECTHESRYRQYPNGYNDLASSVMECMVCGEVVGK